MQLSSLRALETVIQECHPRIENWKGTIVEGVAKCWVVLWDEKKTDEGVFKCWLLLLSLMEWALAVSEELRHGLRAICAKLWEAAPSVRIVSFPLPLGAKRSLKDWQEYIRLLKLNATIFDNLVGDFVDRQSVETEELVATDA